MNNSINIIPSYNEVDRKERMMGTSYQFGSKYVNDYNIPIKNDYESVASNNQFKVSNSILSKNHANRQIIAGAT